MNLIFSYLQDYLRNTDKWFLGGCALFAALLITLNFRLGIETRWIYSLSSPVLRFLAFYGVYATAFIIPFIFSFIRSRDGFPTTSLFWCLLLLAPAIFAFKVSFTGLTQWVAGDGSNTMRRFYAIIINMPSRLILVVIPLFFIYQRMSMTGSFWGLTTKSFNWHPYALMLLLMVPLIFFASTRADFLHMYPKLKQVAFTNTWQQSWWYKLLYEISYGTDFLTIEIFFRGFLVFAFVRYAGSNAILPMAVFYCSIHFGKPFFECISSFFGGVLLGIIAYRTQSILGGIMVHLGIAWMMEIGGYLGNYFKS